MAEDSKDGGLMLGIAASIVGGGTAAGVRSNRLSTIASQRQVAAETAVKSVEIERRQTPRQKKDPRKPKVNQENIHRQWQERELNENPDEFRKQIKKRRLADKAARASKMAKGLTKKMGALGATAGMADAVGAAKRAEAEGGSFEARFGKFAEGLLGLPPGSTQRPLTETEKNNRWST